MLGYDRVIGEEAALEGRAADIALDMPGFHAGSDSYVVAVHARVLPRSAKDAAGRSPGGRSG